MALVQTDAGDLIQLEEIRAHWNGSGALIYHLVKANWTPSESTVEGDMTEADFPGYTSQTATTWTAPHMVSGKARTEADPLVFTRSTTGTLQNIYGYWAEPSDSPGDVSFSEKFAAPIPVTNADEGIVVYPRYTQDTE